MAHRFISLNLRGGDLHKKAKIHQEIILSNKKSHHYFRKKQKKPPLFQKKKKISASLLSYENRFGTHFDLLS